MKPGRLARRPVPRHHDERLVEAGAQHLRYPHACRS
jgi:hypothetical protein